MTLAQSLHQFFLLKYPFCISQKIRHPFIVLGDTVPRRIRLQSTLKLILRAVKLLCISTRWLINIGHHTQRKYEKKATENKTTSPALWFMFCKEPKLPYRSITIVIFKSKHESLAVDKQWLESGGKLRTEESRTGTLLKLTFDSQYLFPVHAEPPQNNETLSTQSCISSHIEYKPAHLLLLPVAKPSQHSPARKKSCTMVLPYNSRVGFIWNVYVIQPK